MPRLIFFTGHAGAGKTTLSKRAVPHLHARTHESFAYLDKDTLYGRYSAAMMRLLTGDPDDRDSPTFLAHLREPEYAGLLETAREMLELGVNVVVCAPFSREIQDRRLFDAAALGMPADTRIAVVWLTISEAAARARIIERGHVRDTYKLAHWDEYRARRFEPSQGDYPQLLVHDNTHECPASFHRLIEALAAR